MRWSVSHTADTHKTYCLSEGPPLADPGRRAPQPYPVDAIIEVEWLDPA